MAYRAEQNRSYEKVQPPQAIDAERAVLGAILKDPEAIYIVLEIFDSPDHFYVPRHREIFSAILELNEKTEPCDITTVSNVLLKNNRLDKIGGRVYLVELVEEIASIANLKYHTQIVMEKSTLRKLISISSGIIEDCYKLEQPVGEILDIAESHIFAISQIRLKKSFSSLKELLPTTFEQIEDLQSPDSSLAGVKTGFDEIDKMTNGLHNGELIIIAGRPSMGKSALVMNIAEHVAAAKKSVAIFSLEMSDESLSLRMLCGRARVSQQKLRAGHLKTEEWPRLTTAGSALSELDIFIDDSPTLTSLEMRAKARRLKSQFNLGLVVVDYIQMMHNTGRYENRQQEISTISRSMKVLAKELNIPVIACSQLSRMVEQRGGEKRPQLSDLRESGAIEQDADVVMFVYRPEFYLTHLDRNDPKYIEVEGKAEIIIAKQRNGPTGVANLTFIKEFARFENQAPGYREVPPDVTPVDGGENSPF